MAELMTDSPSPPGAIETVAELLAECGCSNWQSTLEKSMHAPITLAKMQQWLLVGNVGLVMKFLRQAGIETMAERRKIVMTLVDAHTSDRLHPAPFEVPPTEKSTTSLAELSVAGYDILSSSSASLVSSRLSSPRNSLASPFMNVDVPSVSGGSPSMRTLRVEGTPPQLRRDAVPPFELDAPDSQGETYEIVYLFSRGSKPTGATPWLRRAEPNPDAPYRLISFGWTGNRGGQGSDYQTASQGWSWSRIAPEFEVYDVILPGRSLRIGEPARTELRPLIKELALALRDALDGGRPYAFVGFAFGAVIAYEVAMAMAYGVAPRGQRPPGSVLAPTPPEGRRRRSEGPALVMAVSAEGPDWPGRPGMAAVAQGHGDNDAAAAASASAASPPPPPLLHALDDAAFERVLRERGGTEAAILDEEELRSLFLPVVRADIQLEETYVTSCDRERERLLHAPIVAVLGERPGRDRERTALSGDDARRWMTATRASRTSKVVALAEHDWFMLEDEAGARAVLALVEAFFREHVRPFLPGISAACYTKPACNFAPRTAPST